MSWTVVLADGFEEDFSRFDEAVQDELLARARLLEEYGPQLGRPFVDTLAGSRHANMKELRFDAAGGVWRVAFAFDPGTAWRHPRRWRQIRGRPATVLPRTDPDG